MRMIQLTDAADDETVYVANEAVGMVRAVDGGGARVFVLGRGKPLIVNESAVEVCYLVNGLDANGDPRDPDKFR